MTAVLPASTSHRVPAEHRLLGLDKRTLPFAIVALVVWLLWAVVLPWIDSRVAWTQSVEAGDVIQVSDDVTFVPAAGWGLREGLLTTDETRNGQTSTPEVVLVSDGIVFAVQPGPWSGTPAQLLDQVEEAPTIGTAGEKDVRLAGDPTTIQTTDGDTGVGQGFVTTRGAGVAAAYVFGGEGVLIEVLGAPEQMAQRSQEIVDMIATFTDEAAA